jgi:predicted O-linked N-acetylglucosamine transferase (SPINDLY family)
MASVASDLAAALDAHRNGQLAQAERLYRDIQDQPAARHLLGVLLCQTARASEGASLIASALKAGLDDPLAYANLGAAYLASGTPELAVEPLMLAAQRTPNATTVANLGAALVLVGRTNEAIDWLIRLPEDPSALTTLGRAWFQLGDLELAAEATRRAIASGAGSRAFANLCEIERARGDCDAAIEAGEEACRLEPTLEEARVNLAGAYGDIGDTASSVALLQGITLDARNASAVLMGMHYQPDCDVASLRSHAEAFGKRFAIRVRPPARGGGIGFVTGDARQHPVGRWLRTVLRRLPIRVAVYHSHHGFDEVTHEIRDRCLWRSIVSAGDHEVAAQIEADGIDLLIDLSGHTAHNRLPLFALRPARVMASAIGWFGTTGLDAIDYFLADEDLVPLSDEDAFVETIFRLPNGLYAYEPPHERPVARRTGLLLFGYFGSLSKLNATVMREWARLLGEEPGARLLLHRSELRFESSRRHVVELLAGANISADRVEFRSEAGEEAYCSSIAQCHLALDAWPFGSGTCAFDALWMGVPFVAWSGDRMTGRMARSILRRSGFERWIAQNWVEGCLSALSERPDPTTMRQQMAASALMDVDRYTNDFLQAIDTMRRSI